MTHTIGYMCDWKKNRKATWSHTAYTLFEALSTAQSCTVVDLDVKLSTPQLLFHQLINITYFKGLQSRYRFTPGYVRAIEHRAAQVVEQAPAMDGIIQIGDVYDTSNNVPFFIYQDLSVDLIVEYKRSHSIPLPEFEHFTRSQIQFRQDRQRRIYERCAGIFCMSHWLANHLEHLSGIDPSKIHVVHAGMNVLPSIIETAPRASSRPTVLFIGRNFFRKGGDILLNAFPLLQEKLPEARLIVAGPAKWPIQSPVPSWVDFLGNASWDSVQDAYRKADLFCLPTRFDAFGIAFIEALSNGIPCIGRNDFAMPEFIDHGNNGYLIDSDRPEELASLMYDALTNPEMKSYAVANMNKIRKYYAWERVAQDMIEQVEAYTRSSSSI